MNHGHLMVSHHLAVPGGDCVLGLLSNVQYCWYKVDYRAKLLCLQVRKMPLRSSLWSPFSAVSLADSQSLVTRAAASIRASSATALLLNKVLHLFIATANYRPWMYAVQLTAQRVTAIGR